MSIDNILNNANTKKSLKKKTSLLINIISNWCPLIVNCLVAFFLTPYIIATIGKENYGAWTLAGSFIGYYGLLRLGVGAGIMRYIPYYIGLKNHKNASEIFSSAMGIFLPVSLLIVVISIFAASSIAHFFNTEKEFSILLRILGFAAAIECIQRVIDTCVRAHERWVAANITAITTAIFRALGLSCCLYLGRGIIAMGYVVLGTAFFSLILAFLLFIYYCNSIKVTPGDRESHRR